MHLPKMNLPTGHFQIRILATFGLLMAAVSVAGLLLVDFVGTSSARKTVGT